MKISVIDTNALRRIEGKLDHALALIDNNDVHALITLCVKELNQLDDPIVDDALALVLKWKGMGLTVPAYITAGQAKAIDKKARAQSGDSMRWYKIQVRSELLAL